MEEPEVMEVEYEEVVVMEGSSGEGGGVVKR